MVPCLLHEDEHLLVVNKPAGLNTHAPSPYAGEGIYEWLRHREPRWSGLAIIHRLDKDTSGVLVFSKTALASRSLSAQFTRRSVRKSYLLLTDRRVPSGKVVARSKLRRAGEKYVEVPEGNSGEPAETRFQIASQDTVSKHTLVRAEPLTGRTHQIRVHAAAKGFPILGDTLYGGTAAARMCLHAAEISFEHPASLQKVTFNAPAGFDADPRWQLRAALIDRAETSAFRVIHGASDGWPGWHVDLLGEWLLSQSEAALTERQLAHLARLRSWLAARGVYHKHLTRAVRRTGLAEASPQKLDGETAPDRFEVVENGLRYELSFTEGYSVGLFLDQRENRRRLLTGHLAADFQLPSTNQHPVEVLNTFAYTCGFSVCAARAGALVTSLDLSKKYLEWGRRNFELNQIDPAAHDFIFGDTFDWLKRLGKKSRRFDLVVLDPPTFSQSKQRGVFRAQSDYGQLVEAALPLVKPGGVLFASSNAADWTAERFVASLEQSIGHSGRTIIQRHYVPQPPDSPISRGEPAYLKTIWLRLD